MASIAEVRRRFELAPELPSGLRYKVDVSNNAKKGAMAGSQGGQGYFKVVVLGKYYSTHHIVAMLADIPRWKELRALVKSGRHELVIDHIDGNKENNSPSNLRIITARENTLAGKTTKGKSSKYLGVSKYKDKWKATIHCPHIKRSLSLGIFDSEEEAHYIYIRNANKMYPQDDNSITNA
ncbi:hypothetical protein A134_06060 [Vibrio crassostreae 9CS106]|nr:hypothetical protein A134_06060 [Vibrio crassostreae 9CS106]